MVVGGLVGGNLGAAVGYVKGESEKKQYYEKLNEYHRSKVDLAGTAPFLYDGTESFNLLLLEVPMGLVPLVVPNSATVTLNTYNFNGQ